MKYNDGILLLGCTDVHTVNFSVQMWNITCSKIQIIITKLKRDKKYLELNILINRFLVIKK